MPLVFLKTHFTLPCDPSWPVSTVNQTTWAWLLVIEYKFWKSKFGSWRSGGHILRIKNVFG